MTLISKTTGRRAIMTTKKLNSQLVRKFSNFSNFRMFNKFRTWKWRTLAETVTTVTTVAAATKKRTNLLLQKIRT